MNLGITPNVSSMNQRNNAKPAFGMKLNIAEDARKLLVERFSLARLQNELPDILSIKNKNGGEIFATVETSHAIPPSLNIITRTDVDGLELANGCYLNVGTDDFFAKLGEAKMDLDRIIMIREDKVAADKFLKETCPPAFDRDAQPTNMKLDRD